MDNEELQTLCNLLNQQRWAALATLRNGQPHCTMVAYAINKDLSAITLHLSALAPHTQRLTKEPTISLAISQPDNQVDDPQTLARATLNGTVKVLTTDDEAYLQHKQRYLQRLPNAEMLFSFADFNLYEFIPETIRYVGGFARAGNVDLQALSKIATQYEQ